MKYWLMKSEPEEFSIDDLQKRPKKTEHWDGVRNYQARNFMRDEMKLGDQVFFYHSNCDEPGIVGIAEVVKEGYPDFTAWDPNDKHYDPKTDPENPRWMMVDIRFVRKFVNTVSLKALKANPALKDMRLIQRGNRLSVMPVEKKEWQEILKMEKLK
jgi:predicted RNA-binding protein with PUA-like domain